MIIFIRQINSGMNLDYDYDHFVQECEILRFFLIKKPLFLAMRREGEWAMEGMFLQRSHLVTVKLKENFKKIHDPELRILLGWSRIPANFARIEIQTRPSPSGFFQRFSSYFGLSFDRNTGRRNAFSLSPR